MENLLSYVRELFVFQGRIGRLRFILTYLVITVFTAVAHAVFYPSFPLLLPIPMFFSLFMQAANAVKRLHDANLPWFYIFIIFIPVANVILFLFLILWKGTTGPNKYGDDPLIK